MSANAGEIRARMVLNNDEFKRKMNETRQDMKQTGFSAEQMNQDFGKIQKASLLVGTAVAAGIGGSVKVAADFEQSMARVQAISGSTSEEFARQETAARKMSSETMFSASEAAEGMAFLAMAGFDVNEQIATLHEVLDAAIAGNMDLEQSADVVTNIMTGFGLEAEDAGRAVDVLVKASTTANTDIPQLGEAMKYVGPVASSLGWSIEETAAAVGTLSDAGIQGGQAGTVLRASLLALTDPTGQTKKAMEELNIEVRDAEGNMKPMPELMGHIADSMDGMTDTQKTQTAAQLVGTQAAAGFITLLDEGEDGLADYVVELENAEGAAAEMADIQANTLNGSFKEFQSVVEEAGIKIGKEFLPVFKDIVDWGVEVVGSFDDVNTSQVVSLAAFAGTAAAIGLTISTIGKLVIAVRGLMASMGPAGWLVAGLSVVGGLIAANKVTTEEAVEVNMEHANSLEEESTSLSNQIDRYEALEKQNKLTNDEMAEFVDIQSRIAMETDSEKIEEMQDRYDKLQDKSGLTNEEMAEFLGLNDDIIEKVPDSNVHLTDQGNILLDNTDAAKGYNEQLLKELELELRKQATIASSELEANIKKHKDALKEQNDLADDYLSKQEDIENAKSDLALAEMLLADARESGNESDIRMAEEKVEKAEELISSYEGQGYELSEQIIEQEEIINNIELEIAKGQEAYQGLIDYRLEQVDINAEKGKEIEEIDKAIKKTKDLRAEAIEKYTVDGKITSEGQEHVNKYNDQIDALGNAKSEVTNLKGEQDRLSDSIDDSVGGARDLNYELDADIKKHLEVTGYGTMDADDLNERLSRSITKRVNVQETVRRFGATQSRSRYKHGGGFAGTPSSGVMDMPELKLHEGGFAQRLQNAPLHNEVDARLLQNELVLTEGQQANLFRMIESGQTGASADPVMDDQVIALLQQLVELTEDGKDFSIVMNEQVVGKAVEPHVTSQQNRKSNPNRGGRRR